MKVFKEELSGDRVLYMTDSQVCQIVSRKGSGRMNLHGHAVEIRNIANEFNIDLSTAWISRNFNELADFYSKDACRDNWEIRFSLFNKISVLSGLNFSLDPFANQSNTKCDRFYSKFHCPGSLGVNGLNFSWHNEVIWACPPPSLLSQCLNHMRICKVEGVLILPEWLSLPVWPMLSNKFFKNATVQVWNFPGKLFLKSNDPRSIFNHNFKGAIRIVQFDFR